MAICDQWRRAPWGSDQNAATPQSRVIRYSVEAICAFEAGQNVASLQRRRLALIASLALDGLHAASQFEPAFGEQRQREKV